MSCTLLPCLKLTKFCAIYYDGLACRLLHSYLCSPEVSTEKRFQLRF